MIVYIWKSLTPADSIDAWPYTLNLYMYIENYVHQSWIIVLSTVFIYLLYSSVYMYSTVDI